MMTGSSLVTGGKWLVGRLGGRLSRDDAVVVG